VQGGGGAAEKSEKLTEWSRFKLEAIGKGSGPNPTFAGGFVGKKLKMKPEKKAGAGLVRREAEAEEEKSINVI